MARTPMLKLAGMALFAGLLVLFADRTFRDGNRDSAAAAAAAGPATPRPESTSLRPAEERSSSALRDSQEHEAAEAGSDLDPIAEFADWSRAYVSAVPEKESALVSEGIALAQKRRPVFKQLIQNDPKAALEQAVPMVVRQKLPPAIVALLEKRVNGVAVLRTLQATPMPGEPPPSGSLTFREAEFQSGKTYRAHVYGRREAVVTWVAGASLNGVAIDADFAVSELPSRTLELGEIPPADKPAVTLCPVSGQQVLEPDQIPSEITASTPAVETATETLYFCSAMHIDTLNQTMIMGEGVSGGAFGFTGILPAAPTPSVGTVKVLVIPMTYADQNAVPTTEAALYSMLRDVSEFYSKASFGRLTLVGVVTPPVKLPHNEAWYVNRDTSNGGDISGTSVEHSHARDEARKLGFDSNDYDCIGVRHTGGPGSYGGLGGGSSVWARSDSASLWAHEIGHCFGLGHANFWDTSGTSSIGNGINAEYGDSFDNMGSGPYPGGHYNAQAKSQVRWMPSNFIQPVTASGVYRIHAMDTGTLDPSRRYALTIAKDAQKTYWGEVRTLQDTNSWIKSGMILGWRYPNGGGGNIQLIDTTPGSPFAKEDAPISLGSTFSDLESGIHLTTVAANDNPRSMDVQIHLGQFPANQRPSLSLAPSADVVPLNATVTFTATASDPDGDPLAYAWQHFGDSTVKIVSPNGPVITRQFTTAGTYIVTCTVSDMKGGTTTRNQLITVGTGNSRYTINGRVTLLGAGLQDVVITANGANGVITDADGYFTIPNLSANTYSLTPLLYGYTFGELFNNSITVGPNFTGADFEATAQSVVTISAPVATANELAPVTPGTFRLTRTGDTSQALVVNVNSAQGSATKNTDYTFSPDYASGSQGFSTFTIPADADTLDITLTPVVDSSTEGPETAILQLGPGSGYLVGPQSAATIVITDDDTALPKVSIAATVAATTENSPQPAVFTVARTGSTTSDLIVSYALSGTAASGSDFTALSGSVTIPIGSASATIDVVTANDSSSESAETVKLTLSSNAAYLIDSTASNATASIYDDDTQVVTVTAMDATAQEVDLTIGGAQADTGTFVITRSGDTSGALTVYYAFAGVNGSGVMALHGVDFEALLGSVVIPAGQTQASVTVLPRFDSIGEGPEQAVIYLGANATNYVIGGSGSATVTINDNPGDTPYIDVVNTSSAAEPSTSGAFRISVRGGSSANPLPVNYTLSGTAVNGTDYDSGSVWSAQASSVTDALHAVWAADANNAWSVGDGGVILKWDGSAWSAQSSGTTNTLRSLWGSSATSVWAVGDGGTILFWNGSAWSAQSSGTTNTLRSLWGSSATSVWAVGDGGTILFWNGSVWSSQTSGTTAMLNSVWGSDASNVWAAGAGGAIRKWNGTTWGSQTSGTTETLRAIWGSSATSLWAVGTAGKIIRSSNGSSWSSQTSGTTLDLHSIWGADANNLWACGHNGVILRTTNGSTWTMQTSNATQPLHGVRGLNTANVWAVGDGGWITNWSTAASLPLTGTVVLPAGASTVDVTIRPIDDAEAEDLESVTLSITPGAGYQTYAPTAAATLWLRDNDNTNTVYVDTQVGTSGSSTFTEGASTTPVKFYVSRTGSTAADLTVNYTVGGTATSGSDYTALSGSVTIPAGALGADVPVSVINDTAFEGTETITFDFAAGSYSRSYGAVMFIADNDTATATVGFQSPSSSGSESVTSVNIPVTLSAAQADEVTVQYAVSSTNSSGTTATLTTHALPYWVRVVKEGNTITHFESNDGAVWVQRGGSFTVSNLGSASYLAGIAVASGSTTARTATIDNFTVTGLSAGGATGAESSTNLGNASPSGTHSVADGVYSFDTPGSGIATGSTSDNFRFVYLPVTNSANCTVTARLVAIGTTSSSARLGVMLRSSTAQGSVYAASLATGAATSSFYTMNRTSTNSSSNSPTALTSPVLPQWFQLVRTGDSFATSFAKDGVTWTSIGNAQTIAAGPTVLAGLAVSAASDGSIATGTFDNVTINGTPATDLLGRTVGFVNEQGSESFDGSVWTVNGSGNGITGSSDEAHFAATAVSGDFTLIGRLTSLTGGGSGAQAGVMMRHTRDGYSRQMHTGWVKSGSMEQRHRLHGVTTAFGSGVDFELLPGVLTFAPGETTQNIVLNVVDDSMDEPDNLVTIQLLNANGANVPSTNQFHGYTIVDDDNPPANPFVGFASTSSSALEGAGTVNLTVSLSAPASGAVSVDYAVTGGTATNGGTDYDLAAGTLSFAAGETVQAIPISITDDAVIDANETIQVTLSNPAGLQLGSIAAHTATITDNDLPVVSIVADDPSASETGADPGQFTITRTGPTTAALNVTLARTGTAASGSDFSAIATPLNLAIPIGQSSVTLTVTPIDDSSNERSETVIETVSPSSNYTTGTPATATVAIADNDRSTVTLVANDAVASENGDSGQFTITRTAPTSGSLTVTLTIAGTATNGTDYTSIATSVAFTAGQVSRTVTVAPVEDGSTEGDEQVTVSIASGSYDIGAAYFDNVTIADNDSPPVLFINSPSGQGPLIANGNGVIVSASISDDGAPVPVTQTWSQVSGPGTATIESPSTATTAVTFDAPGNYMLRCTATDTQFTVTDQVTIVVGSALVAADWITQDLGPSSQRRGQGLEFGGLFTVTGTGAGYSAVTTDQAHVMVRQVSGDGSILARLTSLPVSTALAGVTIRDSMARGARRAVLGFVPGTGLQFRARTTASTNDTVVASQTGLSLPLWLKLERNATTDEITASFANDAGGSPDSWTQLGATTAIAMDSLAELGLTTTNNSTAGLATAVFDSVSLTPVSAGPALLSEDATASPAGTGSGIFSGGTYTIVGSTSGYYHGWQYYGDMVVTARLASFSSGAGSAIGGIRVAESMENGAYAHLGRIPQGAYSGYLWTSIAGGSGGGVPSGVSAGNWIRIIRKGNSITGYRASDVSGSPGSWIQIGQPQTVIMTTPVFVGFFVNNASGVGLNTCTFTGLSIAPLNKAPIVDTGTLASAPVTPLSLDATVTDDNYPAPINLTSLWTQISGPDNVVFGNSLAIDTTATFGIEGSYILRLAVDDGGVESFDDLPFTGYTSAYAAWQAAHFPGGSGDPNAAMLLDPDFDGQVNLIEYAFGTDPDQSAPSNVILEIATISSQRYLRMVITKNPAATDVSYEVQATDDLANETSWTSAGLVIEQNSGTELRVRDFVPLGGASRRFMRVKVSR